MSANVNNYHNLLINGTISGTIDTANGIERGALLISTNSKFEDRLRSKPTPKDIRFEDIEQFMRKSGFEVKVGNDNAHYCFLYRLELSSGPRSVKASVAKPHRSGEGVKIPYIKNILKAVDEIREFANE
ncbi:MAG: hypothetical protein SCM11_05025 [Bacillota bacterium]|nr:hypothetical protein [Bacillota bacterium]